MNEKIEVKTQGEMDAVIKDGNIAVLVSGTFSLVTTGTESPHIVVLAGTELEVVARESSQPRVEAWESSQPRVEAWGSSQPRVEAWGYVQISLSGCVIAKLDQLVSATIHGTLPEVEGGHQVRVDYSTPEKWCDYYGVKVENGVATLYKAVNDDYTSPRGMSYAPGSIPIAEDWDGGEKECGGGLHYSPSPTMARSFHYSATRYVACPVALADIAVHPDGNYPEKVKARGCCAPVWEIDEDGERVGDAA